MSRVRGTFIKGIPRIRGVGPRKGKAPGEASWGRSIDLRIVRDRGLVTEVTSPLPSNGALHRDGTPLEDQYGSTTHHSDLGKVNDPQVVDRHEMGLVTEDAYGLDEYYANSELYKYWPASPPFVKPTGTNTR